MSRFSRVALVGPVIALLSAFPAQAQDKMTATMAPDTMEWGAPPPMLPEGAELAVLSGNPMESGPFVLRMRMPDGYAIAPHTHPTAENVTVLSGMIVFAHDDDPATADTQEIATGGFVMIPAEHPHRAMAQGETVIQVHGDGPFEFVYLDPADDPRGQSN